MLVQHTLLKLLNITGTPGSMASNTCENPTQIPGKENIVVRSNIHNVDMWIYGFHTHT